jgi:hypothetical protein
MAMQEAQHLSRRYHIKLSQHILETLAWVYMAVLKNTFKPVFYTSLA